MSISDTYHLSDEQRTQYWDQGYLVVPNILSKRDVERYQARARRFALGELPPGAGKMVVRDVHVARGKIQPDDAEKGIWKLLNPGHHDPLFRAYASTPKLLDVVEGLIGPDIIAFLLMMIYKPPGIEAEHPFHQDAFYFAWGPHDKIVGTWVALDPTDADNGTLRVVPGSHKFDILDHHVPDKELVNFGVLGANGYESPPENEVVVELQPGEGIFFHSRTLHRTGSNVSDRHRRVLTVHYASAACTMTEGYKPAALDFRLVRGVLHPGCLEEGVQWPSASDTEAMADSSTATRE